MTPAGWLAVAALTLLAGCQLTPPAPVPPSLQLMESQPLVLAPGCEANGSVSVEFTVRMDGTTDGLKLSPAPECVRDALTAWVSSFRYLPPAADIPTGVEWLLVSATRRGS
jgi:hypothetical protein